MPQASEMTVSKWDEATTRLGLRTRFECDFKHEYLCRAAVAFLMESGWADHEGRFEREAPPTEDEWWALQYLVEEWDYDYWHGTREPATGGDDAS